MTAAPYCVELPYQSDPAAVFEAVAGDPWPVLLDSGNHGGERGRFDIIAADPSVTLETWGSNTRVEPRDGVAHNDPADPFALVRRWLGEPGPRPPAGLPFAGGALGYFGYDLARRLERLPSRAHAGEAIPDMAIGVYDWEQETPRMGV